MIKRVDVYVCTLCPRGMSTKWIAYARVSSAQHQGADGLGIAGQLDSMRNHAQRTGGTIVAEFVEVESGAVDDRPQLNAALALAKKEGATVLVARLDRISRDAAFILGLTKNNVRFVCVDNPHADIFLLQITAVIAEQERRAIRTRTRMALQAAKRRGVRLGTRTPERQVRLMVEANRRAGIDFARKIGPAIDSIRATGVTTLQGIADCLNRRGIATRTGKTTWHATTVKRAMAANAAPSASMIAFTGNPVLPSSVQAA